MSESKPEPAMTQPEAWLPPPTLVRDRLAGHLDNLDRLIPGPALALILPTLRAKLRGLSDADTHALLLYLDDLVEGLWNGPEEAAEA